jgi:hypothetical protein
MKNCSKCGVDKDFSEFGVDKSRKDNLTPYCNECRKNIRKNNSKKTSEYNKNYIKNNHDKILSQKKIYRDNNKTLISKNKGVFYLENRDLLLKKQKEYYINNKEKINNNVKIKRKNNIIFKLIESYRSRTNNFSKLKSITKNKTTIEMIGLKPNEFKVYIESLFTKGMSWNNHSRNGWHIDHIIPLSSAKCEEDLYKLSHYTNLRPLWCKENLRKGKKLIY